MKLYRVYTEGNVEANYIRAYPSFVDAIKFATKYSKTFKVQTKIVPPKKEKIPYAIYETDPEFNAHERPRARRTG